MPKKEQTCIHCQKPSPTRVCLHCFFNYDHRTYDSRPLQSRRAEKHASSQFVSSFAEAYAEDLTVMEDVRDHPHHDEYTAPDQAVEQSKSQSIASWFSRLPNF